MRGPEAAVSVCLRCKPAGWAGRIEAELERTPPPSGATLRAIRCLSQCKRPCVVAFSGEGRFTYLFGDLDPARDGRAVLDAFGLYLTRPEGFLERAERPDALRAGILGRVPPLVSASSLIAARQCRGTAASAPVLPA